MEGVKRMNITVKKVILILTLLLLFCSCMMSSVYASSESDELETLLNEYVEDLGDLNDLKQVIDETYNHLIDAETIDDSLKEELRDDVSQLENVSEMNPIIMQVLIVELNSQIDNLTEDNIEQMREEITTIKDWVDERVEADDIDNIDNIDDDLDDEDFIDTSDEEPIINKRDSTSILPYTGKTITKVILVTLIVLASIVFSIMKYRKYKEI